MTTLTRPRHRSIRGPASRPSRPPARSARCVPDRVRRLALVVLIGAAAAVALALCALLLGAAASRPTACSPPCSGSATRPTGSSCSGCACPGSWRRCSSASRSRSPEPCSSRRCATRWPAPTSSASRRSEPRSGPRAPGAGPRRRARLAVGVRRCGARRRRRSGPPHGAGTAWIRFVLVGVGLAYLCGSMVAWLLAQSRRARGAGRAALDCREHRRRPRRRPGRPRHRRRGRRGRCGGVQSRARAVSLGDETRVPSGWVSTRARVVLLLLAVALVALATCGRRSYRLRRPGRAGHRATPGQRRRRGTGGIRARRRVLLTLGADVVGQFALPGPHRAGGHRHGRHRRTVPAVAARHDREEVTRMSAVPVESPLILRGPPAQTWRRGHRRGLRRP